MKRNARTERNDLQVGDTFIAPTGPFVRFPEREMRVLSAYTDCFDRRWVDAEPVRPLPTVRGSGPPSTRAMTTLTGIEPIT